MYMYMYMYKGGFTGRRLLHATYMYMALHCRSFHIPTTCTNYIQAVAHMYTLRMGMETSVGVVTPEGVLTSLEAAASGQRWRSLLGQGRSERGSGRGHGSIGPAPLHGGLLVAEVALLLGVQGVEQPVGCRGEVGVVAPVRPGGRKPAVDTFSLPSDK